MGREGMGEGLGGEWGVGGWGLSSMTWRLGTLVGIGVPCLQVDFSDGGSSTMAWRISTTT